MTQRLPTEGGGRADPRASETRQSAATSSAASQSESTFDAAELSVRPAHPHEMLARLWVHDDEPRNTETWFIARAVKLVRRLCPTIRFLVSYADPSVGHQGIVYRAANWRYDGHSDGERKTPRFDYLCDGKRYSRRSHLPEGRPFERIPRVSKARYVLEVT